MWWIINGRLLDIICTSKILCTTRILKVGFDWLRILHMLGRFFKSTPALDFDEFANFMIRPCSFFFQQYRPMIHSMQCEQNYYHYWMNFHVEVSFSIYILALFHIINGEKLSVHVGYQIPILSSKNNNFTSLSTDLIVIIIIGHIFHNQF